MSTLNGQSVSSTYQMLLKTNSSTGISSVLTNVEDGNIVAWVNNNKTGGDNQ